MAETETGRQEKDDVRSSEASAASNGAADFEAWAYSQAASLPSWWPDREHRQQAAAFFAAALKAAWQDGFSDEHVRYEDSAWRHSGARQWAERLETEADTPRSQSEAPIHTGPGICACGAEPGCPHATACPVPHDRIAAVRQRVEAFAQHCDGLASWEYWLQGPRQLAGDSARLIRDLLALLEDREAQIQQASAALDELVAPDPSKSLADRIRDEFADFRMILDHCTHVYMHITGGRISKPNTLPEVVCAVADDLDTELMNEEIAEATKELKADLQRLREQGRQIAEEIRAEAADCRKSAGVPCQSEYTWHAETYEGWADRLSLLAAAGEARDQKVKEATRVDHSQYDPPSAGPCATASENGSVPAGDSGTAPRDLPDRKLKACESAVLYIARQIQENPDVRYYLGYGTEMFHRIAVAVATLTDKSLDDVEKALREDRQPHYRRRQPEVIRLREQLAELREEYGR